MSTSPFSKFNLEPFKAIIETSDKSLEEKRGLWADLAKSAEKCERYDDMCVFTKQVVDLVTSVGEDLTSDERNLLSVAYKNVIGARRASWRTITSEDLEKYTDEMAAFKAQLESELVSISLDILAQLEDKLEPVAENALEGSKTDSKVFYLKMIGDYYRYLAESVNDKAESPAPFTIGTADAMKANVKAVADKLGEDAFTKKYGIAPAEILNGDDSKVEAQVKHCLRHVHDYAEQAKKYYERAYTIAQKILKPTHPIRLGLALNYSVCHYEILKNKAAACELAKSAFDEAIAKLDKLEESDYKDSTLIMQLLRDNLTLWTSNDDTGSEGLEVEELSEEN